LVLPWPNLGDFALIGLYPPELAAHVRGMCLSWEKLAPKSRLLIVT
jgi:hypothetical protein